MKTIYDTIHEHTDTLGIAYPEILANLQRTDRAALFLSIVFNQNTLEDLANILVQRISYLQQGGDMRYIQGSQPYTQKLYYDMDLHSGSKPGYKWQRISALEKRTLSTVIFDKSDIAIFNEVATNLMHNIDMDDTKARDEYIHSMLMASIAESSDIIEYDASKVCHFLVEKWKNQDVPDYRVDLGPLSPDEKYLYKYTDVLFQTIQHLSKKLPKSTTVELHRNELEILKAAMMSWGKSGRYNTKKLKAIESRSLFPLTLYAENTDRQREMAGSEITTRVFPYKGHLYEYDAASQTMKLASTRDKSFKSKDDGPNHWQGILISPEGEILLFNHFDGKEDGPKAFHSSATGKSALFAGAIQINDEGKITHITDDSGHYRLSFSIEILLFFEEKGLLSEDITYTLYPTIREIKGTKALLCTIQPKKEAAYLQKLMQKGGIISLQAVNQLYEKYLDPNHKLTLEIQKICSTFLLPDPKTRLNAWLQHLAMLNHVINPILAFRDSFKKVEAFLKKATTADLQMVNGPLKAHIQTEADKIQNVRMKEKCIAIMKDAGWDVDNEPKAGAK